MKRQRKANFSQSENVFLAEKYEEHKEIIDGTSKEACANKKKAETWAKILTQFSARFPAVDRSTEDLKNRLSKLKTESREYHSKAKKHRRGTGGGPPVSPPTAAQQKILDVSQETPSFTGLDGVESGEVIDQASDEENEYPKNCTGISSNDHGVTEATIQRTATESVHRKPSQNTKYDVLLDIEIENAQIKRENLKLKQKRLTLEIQLLERRILYERNGSSDDVLVRAVLDMQS